MLSIIGGGLASAGRWLLKNPSILLCAVMGAMFVMVVISKNSEISTLHDAIDNPKTGYAARLTSATSGLAVARGNVATLNDQLKRQSDSIDALKLQGDAAGQKFDTLIAGMASANATTAKKLAALDVAKPGPDKCASAQALVKGAVQ